MNRLSASLCLLAALSCSRPAHASSFKTLCHFTDKADGGDPVANRTGTLIGTAAGVGNCNDCGTTRALTP